MQALGAADFRAAAVPQPLHDDEIHVWFFPRWSGPARAAAESFFVRDVLARYLGVGTDTLALERGAKGKPHLAGAAIEFNLAHSGHALLLALGRAQALGVDLEVPRRTRPVLELAQRFFTAEEAAAIERMPASERQATFLRLWVCKEALLKAHGGGVGFGLERAAFELDARGKVRALHGFSHAGAGPWHVATLEFGDDVCGALAWQGTQRHIRAYRHDAATNG